MRCSLLNLSKLQNAPLTVRPPKYLPLRSTRAEKERKHYGLLDLGTESFIQLRITSLCRESLELDHRVTGHPAFPSNSDRNTFIQKLQPTLQAFSSARVNASVELKIVQVLPRFKEAVQGYYPIPFFVKTKMATQVMVSLV